MAHGLFRLFSKTRAIDAGWVNIIVVCAGLVIWAVLSQGCSGSKEAAQMTAEERFQLALEKFNDEDYLEALEDFRIITLQFQGSAWADDAQFYMAECYFRREQFILAVYEYERLIQTMPTSELVSRARYQRALCYYRLSPAYYLDQQYARQAVDEFQTFIEYHPTDSLVIDAEAKIAELNTKLARKEYENGVTYIKMEYYKAAINSFDHVLEKYHDTPYAERAQLKKAEAMLRRNRYKEAKEEIEKFFSKYPNSSLRGEAEDLWREITSKLSQSGINASSGRRDDSFAAKGLANRKVQ